MRVGLGFDAHAFATGNAIVIGGVRIPWEHGIRAHSDGDVLLHAICDALLGAAALGDLGNHFPDTDPELHNADSRDLLRRVVHLVSQQGLRVLNIDATVIAQAPRLASYIAAMRANIASDIGIAVAAVSVKATTTEGLGFPGRVEGIAAQAVVLLEAA